MNRWTQTLPQTSGYYWFAMNYEDIPLCLYFEAGHGVVETYGYFYNDPLRCNESDGYYFSAYPIETLGWNK